MNTQTYPSSKSYPASRGYSPGLMALLNIRDHSFSMEKHSAQLEKIEQRLGDLIQSALAKIQDHCTPASFGKLKNDINGIKLAVFSINQALNAAKEKILTKTNTDISGLWKQLKSHLNELKAAFQNLEHSGADVLPEKIQTQWESDISEMENRLLPLVISNTESCNVELQMIERYSEEELGKVSQIIYSHIPKDFTAEEAVEYEKDYLSALEDFKDEFKKEKNLWDTFLDILAGGTHQSPSEHVMMERWIEGEKQNL